MAASDNEYSVIYSHSRKGVLISDLHQKAVAFIPDRRPELGAWCRKLAKSVVRLNTVRDGFWVNDQQLVNEIKEKFAA